MLHPRLPEDAVLVQGKNDAGKKVVINSVGGALVNEKGTVLVGPYTYQYVHKYKVKPKTESKDRYGRERVKYKEETKTSLPMWLVKIESKCDFSFTASEIAFSK